jgi:hypothetical protein
VFATDMKDIHMTHTLDELTPWFEAGALARAQYPDEGFLYVWHGVLGLARPERGTPERVRYACFRAGYELS